MKDENTNTLKITAVETIEVQTALILLIRSLSKILKNTTYRGQPLLETLLVTLGVDTENLEDLTGDNKEDEK